MMAYELLKLMMRKVPNYHTVAPKFVKGTFTVCPCGACRHALVSKSLKGARQYSCGRVHSDMVQMGREGNATVSAYGTCDAAQFCQENYENFRLEGEAFDQGASPECPPPAVPDDVDTGIDEAVANGGIDGIDLTGGVEV